MSYPLLILPPPVVTLGMSISRHLNIGSHVQASFWSRNAPRKVFPTVSASSAATINDGRKKKENRPHFRGCCAKIKGSACSRAVLAAALTFDSPGCERTRCHGDPKPLHSSASKPQPSGSPWPSACTMPRRVLQPHAFVLPLGGVE